MAEEEEVIADTPVEEEVLEEEEDFVAASATDIKLFGKWSFDDIEIRDISLVVRQNGVPRDFSPLCSRFYRLVCKDSHLTSAIY